ncbi:alpha/beta hydrolase [Streptosporangium sandarakinum]|uniref:alpha/beta hydrolase n=1 Tax=Streptosporangium sandarakinum TaxID=1260955 RepID=UPI00341F2E6F
MRAAVTVSALALAALASGPAMAHASSMSLAVHVSAASPAAPVAAGSASAATAKGDPTPTPTPTPTPSSTSSAPATGDSDPLTGGTVVDTVAYGRHTLQRMDVWYQPDELKRPGVFLIHGGWWSSGDKKQMSEIARSYAELGYTVFNLNYRLSGTATWPAPRTDTFDAIATARKHAALWSFDPNNYVVIGFSAGGHLATAVGTYGERRLPGLRGVVGVSPVISPITAYNDGADTTDGYRLKLRESTIRLAGGCEPVECPKVWNSMEVPLHASRGDAPTLTLHSEEEFVPVQHSLRLQERLKRFGVPMTVVTQPGADHSSPMYRQPGVAETVQEWIAARLH